MEYKLETLLKHGNRWTKNNMDYVYFNAKKHIHKGFHADIEGFKIWYCLNMKEMHWKFPVTSTLSEASKSDIAGAIEDAIRGELEAAVIEKNLYDFIDDEVQF